jgi:hypothetical protein
MYPSQVGAAKAPKGFFSSAPPFPTTPTKTKRGAAAAAAARRATPPQRMVTTTAPEDAVQPPSADQGAKGEAKRKQSDAPGRGGGGGGGGRGGGAGGQGKKRKNKEVFIYGNYKNYYGYRVSSTAPSPTPFLLASLKKKTTNRHCVVHAMGLFRWNNFLDIAMFLGLGWFMRIRVLISWKWWNF